jgi:N-acetylglucosamine kinase-like BadF-type ATPase
VNPSAQPLYLGVDAGNSKTVAVLADSSGTVLGYGRSGCGDIYGVAAEPLAVAEVVAAVNRALDMASRGEDAESRVDGAAIARAAFCLAGVDWPADELFWREQLECWLPGLASCSLRNDGFALLRAGQPDGLGVALSSGTGGAVVARGPEGIEWSASMWLADPLGGWALGEQAYTAVLRAELGIAPPTVLRDPLLERHGYTDVASLLAGTTGRGMERIRYATLARDVLDAATAGDDVASGIVAQQATLFARYAVVAAKKVDLDQPEIPVVLGGSVLSSESPALRDATRIALAELLPAARATLTPRSPVVGAVLEAIAEGCGALDPSVVDRLTGYAFPPEFLLT